MEQKLKELEMKALEEVKAASGLKELNQVRVSYLGKKDRLPKYCEAWVNCQRKSGQKWELSPI